MESRRVRAGHRPASGWSPRALADDRSARCQPDRRCTVRVTHAPTACAGRAHLLALLLVLPVSACCASGPRRDSFASPHDTLLTFQSAYRREDPATEFRCLSRPLRKRVTHAGYRTFRDRAIEDNRTMAFILDWNDLSDNIIAEEIAPDGRHARLALSVYGHQAAFEFVSEFYVVLRLAPRLAGDPPELRETIFNGATPEAACRLLQDGWLQVVLEDLEITPEELGRVRGWLLDERWKFAELEPVGAQSP